MFLYAIRLIFRQSLFQSLTPAPADFWKYSDVVIDNFIVVPFTLLLIEMVPKTWKIALRWVLAFQIAFAAARTYSQLFKVAVRPMNAGYYTVVVVATPAPATRRCCSAHWTEVSQQFPIWRPVR